jgi:translation initiation factor IF-1
MPESKNKEKFAFGTVIEALPNATFRVLCEGGKEILANLAGKMRLYHIKVFVGNKVKIELNPYEDNKGRIVQRL